MLAIGRLSFDTDLPDRWLSLALALLLGSVAFAALAVGLSGLVRSAEGSSAVVNAIYLPLSFISGAFFSPESFPGFLEAIANVLPLTYFIELVRDVMLHGQRDLGRADGRRGHRGLGRRRTRRRASLLPLGAARALADVSFEPVRGTVSMCKPSLASPSPPGRTSRPDWRFGSTSACTRAARRPPLSSRSSARSCSRACTRSRSSARSGTRSPTTPRFQLHQVRVEVPVGRPPGRRARARRASRPSGRGLRALGAGLHRRAPRRQSTRSPSRSDSTRCCRRSSVRSAWWRAAGSSALPPRPPSRPASPTSAFQLMSVPSPFSGAARTPSRSRSGRRSSCPRRPAERARAAAGR